MGKKCHHKNTLKRIRLVCKIVLEHYEPGNQSKCYRKIWERYVYPVYPCSYKTLLRYINTPIGKEEEKEPEDPNQLKLF